MPIDWDLIRRRREEMGMSGPDLAREVGCKQQTISKLELGQQKYSRYVSAIERVLSIKLLPVAAPSPAFVGGTKIESTQLTDLEGRRDLPVYGAAEGGSGALIVSKEPVDWAKRPQPLANVKDAYGLIIVGESMVPEFRPGDIALVNPHLPPAQGDACVFYGPSGEGHEIVTVKTYIRKTEKLWIVRQWNPAKEIELTRKDWHRCEVTVGRYNSRR